MPVLAFHHLYKSYGEVVALHDVSFEVRRGEVFGLLGPNGAGKSTLIRILMDIIRPNSGSITLFDEPHAQDALDRVGYLPEERGLYVKHKVLEVMTYFGTLKGLAHKEAQTRARTWLKRIELVETEKWRVNRLSKGMSQKVQIAATLLSEPALCVLDEPFSGLDPVNVRMVQDLIHERRNAGLTTILSTHQMNLVETLCDRVALINKGRLMEYGEVNEVRQRYSRPEIRVTLDGALPRLNGVVQAVQEHGTTWRLLLAHDVTPRDVLARLLDAGVGLDHFEKILTPMEEVFIQIVREGKA